jgi:hypothetical protein
MLLKVVYDGHDIHKRARLGSKWGTIIVQGCWVVVFIYTVSASNEFVAKSRLHPSLLSAL